MRKVYLMTGVYIFLGILYLAETVLFVLIMKDIWKGGEI